MGREKRGMVSESDGDIGLRMMRERDYGIKDGEGSERDGEIGIKD